MSTKTAFKRVALVAAAALAIGGLTSVTANAGTAPLINSVAASSTASITTGTYTVESFTAGSADKYYTISSTGGSVLYPSSAPATTSLTTSGSNEVWSAGTTTIGASSFAGTESLSVSVYSATAGTQVVTLTGSASTAITLTITWGAAAALSVANSLVIANNTAHAQSVAGASLAQATSDTLTPVVRTVVATTDNTTAGAAIFVELKNNASTPVAFTGDQISASVSGPGLLKIGSASAITASGLETAANGGTAGRSVVATANAFGLVNIYADGNAGTATVTISDATAGVVLGTVTVVFYSTTIAKLVATTHTNVPLAAVTGFAATATEGINGTSVATGGSAVSVVATDASGNAIPSASGITVTSGTTAVATVGSLTYDATNSYIYVNIVPVSEGSTVITFSDTSTGLVTATATVWVVKAVANTVVASTDAATYDPGTKVVYTLTATDAAGNPIADGTYTGFFSTAPTSNVGLQGALPGTTSAVFASGVNNTTVYSPTATATVVIAGGTVIAGFLASATATATNSATFAVTGSSDVAANAATDAANEATDAANAATDAANAAADSADAATQAAQDAGAQATAALAATVALSQQVTKLLAKVASLATLLAKIAKKVKA